MASANQIPEAAQAGSGYWANLPEGTYPPWWGVVPVTKRGMWAAGRISEGWGAAASQLLGAFRSIPLVSAVLLLLTLYLVAHWARRRQKVALASMRVRWEMLQEPKSQFTVSESFTLGWLNVLLRHLWPTIIEKEAAEIAAKNIKEAIAKLLLEGRNKAPLKFIEDIELEEFTLGLAPPRFHSAHVRYNAAKNYLQFEVDMTFQSSGFQCVLAPKMRKGVMLAGMTGRAEISHFAIAGKALVGCHLFSRSPGIRGIDFSFLEPPTVDVQVSPLGSERIGFALTDLPGVLEVIKSRIQRALAKDMIEPARKFTDMTRVWDKIRAKKYGGQGGLLQLTLVQARELRYSGSGQKLTLVDPYVEVKAGAEIFRTPCVHRSHAPAWNWDFDLRLPELIGTLGAVDILRLRVLDAKALGDPGVLGEAKLDLRTLSLEPNSQPINIWLPLKGSRLGSIHVQVKLLIKVPPEKPILQRSSSAGNPKESTGRQGGQNLPVGVVSIVGAEGTEGQEELRGLLDSEKARRKMAEQRYDDMLRSPSDRMRVTKDPDMRRSLQRPSTADMSGGPSIASSITGGDNLGNSPASWPANILGSKSLSRPPLPRPSSSSLALKDQEGGNGCSSGMFRRSDTALTPDPGAGVARSATPDLAQVEIEKNGGLGGLQRSVSPGSGSMGAESLDSLLREDSLPSQEISPREVLASSADPRGRQTLADAAYNVDTDTGLRGGVAHDLARASYLDLAEAIATGQLRSEQHRRVGADEHANTLQSATGKIGSGGDAAALALVIKVAKLEATLRKERAAAEAATGQLQATVARLEAQVTLEAERRLSEQLRAIIEGGCFMMHRASDSQLRHVWYSPQSNALKWAMSRSGSNSPAPPAAEKNKERHISVKHMAEVTSGARLFPSQDNRGWVGLKTLVAGLTKSKAADAEIPSHVDDAKCISIVFSSNSAVHLELPPNGNGRSRDEWVDGFASLARNGYAALLIDPSEI